MSSWLSSLTQIFNRDSLKSFGLILFGQQERGHDISSWREKRAKMRAEALTPEQRSQIARKAAKTRWAKTRKKR